MKRCGTCGYAAEHPGATQAQTAYWFRRHSCAKHLTTAASRARGDARREAIDRTPRPCLHKQAQHEHGTRACYVLDRCRCEPCAAANAARELERVRAKAYGRYDALVDADPVRAHVQALTEAGMGLKQVAKVSGVAHGALWKLMYGKTGPDGARTPSRRVTKTTAQRLLKLDPAGDLPLAGGAVLSAEASAATHRRLQSLVALGWSMSALGQRLGMRNVTNAIPIVRGDRPAQVATARAVEALFAELCMTPPPETCQRTRSSASRARRYAKAQGWVPPLALDDLDDLLEADKYETDPAGDEGVDEGVDEVAILRRLDGDKSVRLSHAEAVEVARRWREAGRSDRQLEGVTGLKPHRYPRRERTAS